MKKDRNSFFSQFGSYGFNANQQPMMYPNNMNMNPMQPNYNQESDIDARLSKIERELNRIDSRLSKLESTTMATTNNNTDYNFANSMYMV